MISFGLAAFYLLTLIAPGPASTFGIAYSSRIALRKDTAGKMYGAYQGTVSFTTWLAYEDTMNTNDIAVRVKVIATDGKARLKEATATALVK